MNYLIRTLIALLLFILPLPMNAFSYIKGGVAFIGEDVAAPMIGIGQRYSIFSLAALDISWAFAASKERKIGFYTSPRIAALAYLNPCHDNRLYAGGAVSWGYIVDAKNKSNFSGVMAEGILGIEFDSIFLFHPYLEVSQSFPCKRFSNRIGSIGHRASTAIVLGIGI